MRTALDNYLGIHPQALALERQRTEVLAANLANVDTPNYKARDLDFKAALAAAGNSSKAPGNLPLTPPSGGQPVSAAGVGLSLSAAGTLSNGSSSSVSSSSSAGAGAAAAQGGDAGTIDPTLLQYRVPMAPALDGNTVDEQLEQSAFAENSVRYQATVTILGSAMHDLMTAITGS